MDNSHRFESIFSDPVGGFFTPNPHCVVDDGDGTFTPTTVQGRWKNKATGAEAVTAFTVTGVTDPNRLQLDLTPLGAFGSLLSIVSACAACPEVEEPEIPETPDGVPVID